jgi:siroheme synthase (precorrin-2 oxidase/ferrochelatase)
VGAGRVARRKVEGLLASGAVVTVVAPVVDDELRVLAAGAGGRLTIEERSYREQDLAARGWHRRHRRRDGPAAGVRRR